MLRRPSTSLRLLTREPPSFYLTSVRCCYFNMKGPLNRDEGRPNFKRHLEAEQDITPLSPQELQVEVDKRKAAAPWDVPIKTVYEDPSVQEEFKNLLKDPVLAHVADLATYDFKVAQAKRFGTFKHRVQATMASQMLQRPTEEIDYLHQIPLPEHTNSPLLDIYEFEDPDEDVSAPKWKIQPNLYDDNTVEIIEDESTSYSPTLTEEYNQGNAFFAMGTNDPVLNKKLEYANKKLEEIMRYPNLDKVKQEIKLSMWSQHLLDEKMLDTIAGEQEETKNLIENKTPEAPLSYEPLQTYTHYEELVNDLLAKLLPDDGFLRLDPGWKWNVLETGTKVLRCVPLHDYPTEPFHFPDGVLVMRVAKFLKVRDTYLDPVAVSKEIDRLNTRDWVLQKYYGKEADEKDEAKYAYLREGILDRFLLINLRFGTFSVATFTDKVDPTPTEWNPDIEKTKNLFLSNSEILRKTKEDTDIAHMTAYRLPPEWILAIKRTKFPIFAGTGLNSPERRIHGAMKILGRMERDDSPMRADMSEFAQNLPHRMETDHPYISDVMAHQYYEQFPDHQRT